MITIGKMSKACQVSIKTLRWYDQIGLLKPEHTDEKTGFRYYSSEQIEQVLLIRRYKRFGFSLSEIAGLLKADRAQISQALQEKLLQLQEQIDDLYQMKSEIRQILNGSPERIAMNSSIELIETKKTPVYSLRTSASISQYGDLMSRLFKEAAGKGIKPCGAPGTRYYDAEFDPEKTDLEVFFPACHPKEANDEIGGFLCVRILHTGSYSTLNESYGMALKWIEENGYSIIHAPYELYLSDPHSTPDPSEWKTEIYFPVQKKD